MASVMRFDQWQDSNGVPVLDGTGLAIPASALPAGSILQVVSATTSTNVTNTSTTYADSNLSASITPKFATSKILVLVSQSILTQVNASTIQHGRLRIVRDSTAIIDFERFVVTNAATAGGVLYGGGNLFAQVLDSPNTTSATTYKTQIAPFTSASSGRVEGQPNSANSVITLLEIAG